MSAEIPLDAAHRTALLLAGHTHEHERWVDAAAGLGGLNNVAAYDAGDASLAADLASRILMNWQGIGEEESSSDVKLAAKVLELCHEFDDAIEFAAYERTAIPDARAEFITDAAARYDPRILGLFHQITSPRSPLRLTEDLPALPKAVAQLLRTPAAATTVHELESIATADPALAGRLLAAANSGFFDSYAQTRETRHAILRLGIPFARKVLISGAMQNLFASKALQDIWTHSRMVAATAHEFAGAFGLDQEKAYVAGLIHDIGRFVPQVCAAESRVAETSLVSAGFPLVYAENLTYGTDHAVLGRNLLSAWDLPGEIVDAVANHHQPESTPSALASLLYLAEDHSGDSVAEGEKLSVAMRRTVASVLAGATPAAIAQLDRNAAIFAI